MQESVSKFIFCKQGRIYCTAGIKGLCAACAIVTMEILFGLMTELVWSSHCRSVIQSVSRAPNTIVPSLKIWLTSEKIPPSNNSNKDCNYEIRTRCQRSLSNGALLTLHACSSGKYGILKLSQDLWLHLFVFQWAKAQWAASEYL